MRHPGHGNVFIGQGQEPQLDLVAVGLPQGYLFQIDQARQRGFKSKAVSSIHAFINFFQHQPASLECSSLWIEWSDQVGVDKTQRFSAKSQKVLPAPLGPAMMMFNKKIKRNFMRSWVSTIRLEFEK
jgi:hypothetical protein